MAKFTMKSKKKTGKPPFIAKGGAPMKKAPPPDISNVANPNLGPEMPVQPTALDVIKS